MHACPRCQRPLDGPAAVCGVDHLHGVPTAVLGDGTIVCHAPLLGYAIEERYVLVGWVGGGGMGAVYRGLDLRLDREVAVKVLQSSLTATPEERARFEREARAMSRLRSAHTVTVFDYGVGAQGPLANIAFMVMELVEGEALDQALSRGAMRAEQVALILDDITQSLEEAHQTGVVHRDMKPGNVLLTRTPDGRPLAKVIDFGIARIDGGLRTRTGLVLGTPEYMAPEQCGASGDTPLDARVDVYAVGVMLFEMLTARRPFGGAQPLSVIMQQLNAPPPPLGALGGDRRARALEAVVHQALSKAPEARFPSMRALNEAFRAASEVEAPRATGEVGPVARAAEPTPLNDGFARATVPRVPPSASAGTLGEGAGEIGSSARGKGRPRRLIAGAVILVVIGAAVAVPFALRQSDVSPAPATVTRRASPEIQRIAAKLVAALEQRACADAAAELARLSDQPGAEATFVAMHRGGVARCWGARASEAREALERALSEGRCAVAFDAARTLRAIPDATAEPMDLEARMNACRDAGLPAAVLAVRRALEGRRCDEARAALATVAALSGGAAEAQGLEVEVSACTSPKASAARSPEPAGVPREAPPPRRPEPRARPSARQAQPFPARPHSPPAQAGGVEVLGAVGRCECSRATDALRRMGRAADAELVNKVRACRVPDVDERCVAGRVVPR